MVEAKEGGESPRNWLEKLKIEISALPGRKLAESAQTQSKEAIKFFAEMREKGPIQDFLYSEGRMLNKEDLRILEEEVIIVPLPGTTREIPEKEGSVDVTARKLRVAIQSVLMSFFPITKSTQEIDMTGDFLETRYTFQHPESNGGSERTIEIILFISKKSSDHMVYNIGVLEDPDLTRKK